MFMEEYLLTQITTPSFTLFRRLAYTTLAFLSSHLMRFHKKGERAMRLFPRYCWFPVFFSFPIPLRRRFRPWIY